MERATAAKISIVIPVYRGASTVGTLVHELVGRLSATYPLEIVLVNDQSPDESERVCLDLVKTYPNTVVYAAMAKNFGEHNTVMTGLRIATGDLVVTMDDDLQNPPAEVEKLIVEAKRGIDVVYAQFERKEHPWFRNLGSRFNDRVANLLLEKPKHLYLSTFRCLSRFLVDEITRYTGPYPYVDGLILRTTASISSIVVRHDPRRTGESGYTLRKLLAVWLNMSTSFSILPLRTAVVVGLAMAAFGMLLGAETIIERILWPELAVGWASLMTALALFSGIQLILIGTIGEYLGRLLLTVNGTPQGVVRRIVRGDDLAVERRESERLHDDAGESTLKATGSKNR